jgi:hypothetical protein
MIAISTYAEAAEILAGFVGMAIIILAARWADGD